MQEQMDLDAPPCTQPERNFPLTCEFSSEQPAKVTNAMAVIDLSRMLAPTVI
jgi:hypothetical protein